jgi:alpha/beta superfamily hydrolase
MRYFLSDTDMKEEKIFFPSAGIRLEGLIGTNEALSARGGVILCHPHPLHGGDMHNSVITSGVEASCEAGLSTLRFNFRGVGESEGGYSDGVGEKEDVRAAVQCLDATFGDRVHSLIVTGYSFGAWTGLPVAVRDSRINGIVAIAPPLAMYDFSFFKGCLKKKLVIVGSEDQFCPLHLLEEWFQDLQEPKTLTVIQGADHFFFSHHRSLLSPLFEFFKTL